MPELPNPTLDFVFQHIFSDERNADVLVHFLNSVLETKHGPLIESVEIFNPYAQLEPPPDRMSALDFRARTSTNTLIHIELQLWKPEDTPNRSLFNWAWLLKETNGEGNLYRLMQKSIVVNILDFNVIKSERYHTIFQMSDEATGQLLSDELEIHYLELGKLQTVAPPPEQRLERWMLFLAARTKERMEELAVAEPALQKVLTTFALHHQDE